MAKMEQMTSSISRGRTAEHHNRREWVPNNADPARTAENVVYVDRTLEEVYETTFEQALEEYNESQREKRHPERQIPDYLEHVRGDKKLQPMYEFVVQVGSMDVHPGARVAMQIYREWLDEFVRRWGAQFVIKQAIVHNDEATPHMHLELVPRAESARGLHLQNSMNKAVKQAGFNSYKEMLAGWDELLAEVMAEHDIERVAGDRDKQAGGVDIETYKRTVRAREEAERVERETEKAVHGWDTIREPTDEECLIAELTGEVAQPVEVHHPGLEELWRERQRAAVSLSKTRKELQTMKSAVETAKADLAAQENATERSRRLMNKYERATEDVKTELIRVNADISAAKVERDTVLATVKSLRAEKRTLVGQIEQLKSNLENLLRAAWTKLLERWNRDGAWLEDQDQSMVEKSVRDALDNRF